MPPRNPEVERDRFLLCANRLVGSDTTQHLETERLARELGIDPDLARALARHLAQQNLLKYDTGMVWLTAAGVERAEHLALPTWRKWMKDRAMITAIVAAVLSALLTAIFERLIGAR